MSNNKYKEILSILQSQRRLLLSGHEEPDCDSLGTVLGTYLAFGGREKGWRMAYSGPIPADLGFLPGLEQMSPLDAISADDFDAVLLIDCSDLPRAGEKMPKLAEGKPLYCIDHHVSIGTCCDLALVEEESSATGEIMTAICVKAGMQFSDEVALCFYSAMVSDTGGFRYLNTTSRSLHLASLLLPQIDLELVRINLFENRSYANLKIIAACLEKLTVSCQGLLAYAYIDRETMLRLHADATDCYNIVNHVLSLRGVKIGIVFEEYEDHVKISFRSRRGYAIDGLARSFGGGGHQMAAGCKINGSLFNVITSVVAAAEKIIEEINQVK